MALRDLAIRILITAQNQASRAINSLRGEVDSIGDSTGKLKSMVNDATSSIKLMLLSFVGIAAIGGFIKKLTETIQVIQDLRLRLSGLTTSMMDYAASEAYLVSLSDRHHKSISTLTTSYASFLALEQAGIITRQQAIQILQGFSNAQTKTGATQDQLGQSTYGLAQALGTGVVAMEEFKQITEPMPGLATDIANAFGLTVGQLRVLIGTGTVASEEFGRKFVIALQAYEGAAERAGGTVSASYADIGNAYTAMAHELEKPVATGVMGLVDAGKSAYGWIKDNGAEIVATLKVITAAFAGSVVSALAGYGAAKLQVVTVERAHIAALIENERRAVAATLANQALAASNLAAARATSAQTGAISAQGAAELRAEAATLALTNGTIARARAEISALSATVQTTSITYLLAQATTKLTVAEAERSVSMSRLAALGQRQALVAAAGTEASLAWGAANRALTAANTALADSQARLVAASKASGVAMSRMATAGKAAFALIGGSIGAAVIGLYALYTGLEKVTDSEGKAAIKAKSLADALALSSAEVKKMSVAEVDVDFSKTEKAIDDVTGKIKALEKFGVIKLFNATEISAQRANLLQTLDVLKQRKDALVGQKNEQIINFDASTLSAAELSTALIDTKKKIEEISNRVEPLRKQVEDGLIGREVIAADLLELNAYEAKLSVLTKTTGTTAQSQAQLKKEFKDIKEAAKDLAAGIDAATKAQTAAIEQGLTERLAAIDAMNIGEAQKDTQRLTAKLQAAGSELQIRQQAGAAKLALIDQEYQAELAGAATNAARSKEIETQKRQDKLAVYTGLADYYQGEVGRLSQVYATEYQAAQQAKQQLQALAQSHEMALFNIQVSGMDQKHKLDAEEAKYNELIKAAKKEQAKGEQGNQEKINGLLSDAKKLHGDISVAAGTGSAAIREAKAREEEIYKVEKTTLESSAKAHEESAGRAKKAQEEVAKKLGETQGIIADITEKLKADYALKVGIDSASLTAAQSAIADLVKPETKTITIQTINADSAGNSAPAVPVEQSTGGPAGIPAGQEWHLSEGGYPRVTGQLPGYGGGDRVRALLEDGEYVVRKEAVQALGGQKVMDYINQGRLPDKVIKRSTGGIVSDDEIAAAMQKKRNEEGAAEVGYLLNNLPLFSLIGETSINPRDPLQAMLARLAKDGFADLRDYVIEGVRGISADSIFLPRNLGYDGNGEKTDRQKFFDIEKSKYQIKTNLILEKIRAGKGTENKRVPGFPDPINRPQLIPNIPQLSSEASSRLMQPTQANNQKTVTVKFSAPGVRDVSGTFPEADMGAFFDQLKAAGARTSGGF